MGAHLSDAYVALVRHADYRQQPDTPSAWQPWPLSRLGDQQCIEGVDELRQIIRDCALPTPLEIHSSSLLRAWQTAQTFASALQIPPDAITSTDQLTERSVGSVANLTLADIEQAIALDPRYEKPPENWKSSPHYRLPFPGAESLKQAGERVANYIEQTIRRPSDSNQLHIFVGHGASLRHAAWHLGVFSEGEVARHSMFHARPIILRHTGGKWLKAHGEWKPRQSNLD